MDEIRKSEAENERRSCWENSLMRGMDYRCYTYTHEHERQTDLRSVYTEVQIYVRASSSPSLDRKDDSHLPISSPPSQATGWRCDGVDLNPFWLIHVTRLHPPGCPQSLVTKMKFSLHHSCYNTFFPPFLPVGSGVTVGSFFRLDLPLYSSHSPSKFPHCCLIRPQIALPSCEDNLMLIKY